MQSAMNCQNKTYQFNNATLTLQQVIGQVNVFNLKLSIKKIYITFSVMGKLLFIY